MKAFRFQHINGLCFCLRHDLFKNVQLVELQNAVLGKDYTPRECLKTFKCLECPLYLYKHQKVISVKIALEGYKIHATTFCDENVFPT